MSVAVKQPAETQSPPSTDRLAVESLVGALYLVGSLGVVFYALPRLWFRFVPLGTGAVGMGLLVLAMSVLAIGLWRAGIRLAGPALRPGLAAGTFCVFLTLLVIAGLTSWFGLFLEAGLVPNPSTGIALTLAFAALLCVVFGRLFLSPRCDRWLIQFEEQGWFSTTSYKRNQGQRIRRYTMVGILAIVGSGIYTLNAHKTLENGPRHWGLPIPYLYVVQINAAPIERQVEVVTVLAKETGLPPEEVEIKLRQIRSDHAPWIVRDNLAREDANGLRELFASAGARASVEHQVFVLLPYVAFSLLILLSAGGLWLAWRVVNYPVFADFLIATEAEMNKVSWTTRRRLVQDTIVVLVTVFLLTVFLFVVDQVWAWGLTRLHVLQVPPASASEEKELDW